MYVCALQVRHEFQAVKKEFINPFPVRRYDGLTVIVTFAEHYLDLYILGTI